MGWEEGFVKEGVIFRRMEKHNHNQEELSEFRRNDA